MCVSVSGLQPSPSALIPLSICQHKKKKRVLFLSGISHLPLKHLPHPSLVSSPSCSAPHQQEKGPAATAQADSNPSTQCGSAPGSSLLCSRHWAQMPQTGTRSADRCTRVLAGDTTEPWPCWPCSPWPHCSLSARHPVPQLPSLCHIHHRHSEGFTASSSNIYMASTQLSHHHFF